MWRYHPQSLLTKMITCYVTIKCYTQNIILIGRLIKYAQKLYIYTFTSAPGFTLILPVKRENTF